MPTTALLAFALATASAPDVADYAPEPVDLEALARLEPREPVVSPGMLAFQEETPQELPATASAPARFGTKNTWRFGIYGGGGVSIEASKDAWLAFGGIEFSYFFLENVSLEFQVNGFFVNQDAGNNAVGGSLALLFRWHCLDFETWSIYLDGGAGIAGFSHEVPTEGSSGNFTPTAGGGVSFDLPDTDMRMMVGLRWFHVSNGSTASDNPGLDTIIGYVGVSWPF